MQNAFFTKASGGLRRRHTDSCQIVRRTREQTIAVSYQSIRWPRDSVTCSNRACSDYPVSLCNLRKHLPYDNRPSLYLLSLSLLSLHFLDFSTSQHTYVTTFFPHSTNDDSFRTTHTGHTVGAWPGDLSVGNTQENQLADGNG